MLTFRKAGKTDMMLYFEWANDDEVRNNAINRSKILLEDHEVWFNKKITGEDTLMLLCMQDDRPVGQLRIDMDPVKKEAIIDYSVDKASRGKGLGTLILKEGRRYFSGLYKNYVLTGMVNEKNAASISAFIKAGYEQDPGTVLINNERYLKFSADA